MPFTLQRYVFRELVLHFLFTLFVVTGIFVVAIGVQSLYRFSDLPLSAVVRSFPFFIPYSFAYTVPMAVLVAVVLTFGRLSQDGEIIAVRTSGVHLYSLVAPALFLGLLISLASFWVNDRLIPYSNLRKRDLTIRALEQMVDDINAGRGRFPRLPNVNLSSESPLPDGTLVKPVFIFENPKTGKATKVIAERARIRIAELEEGLSLLFHFEKGQTFHQEERVPVTGGETATADTPTGEKFDFPAQFGSWTWSKTLDELFEFKKKPEDRKTSELLHMARVSANPDDALDCMIEVHRRLAFSAACFAFALVGAPLGILFRRGGKMTALFISFLVVMVVYYPILMVGQGLSEQGTLPPYVGIWLADAVVGIAGAALLYRVFQQ